MRDDGRGPKDELTLAQALAGDPNDPCIGAIMEFKVSSTVPSVDAPGFTYTSTAPDPSVVPAVLTQQIPIVAPVRTRLVEWGRSGNGDSRNPQTGQCTPDCPETATSFPWTVKVNGQEAHSMNANRISLLVPKPGEIEHWTYVNGGGGWDHPIHLHFEEGITMNRGGDFIPPTELNVRKDVWRLGSTGKRTGHVPGPVRRIRRILRQPLPQYGARGFRLADAHSAPDRGGRIAASRGHADAQPDPRRRGLHHTGDSARRRPQITGERPMQEKTMKTRRTILTLMGAGAAGALAFTSVASPAAAQTATSTATSTSTSQGVIAAPAPGAKKPTTATPAMIDEAIQRSQARTAKAVPTATSAAKPEQFGSEEPFTYVPGNTAN